MIRILAALIILITWIAQCLSVANADPSIVPAAFSQVRFNATASFSYNVTAPPFSAACNGTGNDAPALYAGAAALLVDNPAIGLGAQTTIIIPPGSDCVFGACLTATPLFAGYPNMTLLMTGATVDTTNASSCTFFVGQAIQNANAPNVATQGALFDTVAAGQTCITMATSGQESRFAVGSSALLVNDLLQGGGTPVNNAIWEFQTVLTSGSGQVCFTAPLRNGYSATFPDYGFNNTAAAPTGNFCSNICGGPATIFPLASSWNANFTLSGGTWLTGRETFFQAQTVTLTGVTMTGASLDCIVPSVQQTMNLINDNFSGCPDITIDKEIDTININNTNVARFDIESGAPRVMNLTNGSVLTELNGAPLTLNCTSSTISDLLGATNYNAQVSFVGNACSIGAIAAAASKQIINANGWTVTGGVFTNTIASGVPPWPVVGAKYFFVGQFPYSGFEFHVTGLSQSSPNFSIATDSSLNAIPGIPASAGSIYVAPDPYPNWSCTNCTGSVDAVDYSQSGAQNAPLYTYSNRIYTCTAGVATVQAANPGVPVIDINSPVVVNAWGTVVSVSIDVTQVDTNSHATLPFNILGPFQAQAIDNTSGAQVTTFAPVVSLLHTGVRTVTQTTTSGSQTGDTLAASGNISLSGVETPSESTSLTGETAATCPIVSITIQDTR